VPSPDSRDNSTSVSPRLAILGPDVVVAASPASQAQLIEATTRLGFDAVVPGSWGDELIAETVLRHLGPRARESVVLCACPEAHALAAGDGRLARHVLALVAPGVAAARYLRMLYAPARVRITYLGQCGGVTDRDVDDIRSATWVMEELATAGIDASALPDESAPGHRRHLSLPGGAPHPDHLRQAVPHELITLLGDDAAELAAAHIARGAVALIDLAPAGACGCAGGPGRGDATARALLVPLEPPRATGDVLSPTIRPDLTLGALRGAARAGPRAPASPAHAEREVQLPTVGLAASPRSPSPSTRRRPRTSGVMRAIGALAPASRTGEGRSLPRAYLGHRNRRAEELRLTPDDAPAGERVITRSAAPLADAPSRADRASGAELVVRLPRVEPYRVPPPPSRATSLQRLTLLVLTIAALVAVLVTAIG
jgi:hypothetical protein